MNLQKSKAQQILNCYSDDIEKSGGEGSRGGKIIGHTKSGKPIYDHKGDRLHPKNKDFTADEHREAADLHKERISIREKEDQENRDRGVGTTYAAHEQFRQWQHEQAAKRKMKN